MVEANAEVTSAVRDESWTRTDTWLFVSFALGYTLEAYIFTLAPVATGWFKEPAVLRSLLLSWAPLWLIIGIGIAGPLGDWLGRRTTFYITMACYGIGAIGLFFSSTYTLVLIFLALLLAAAGGEMNMIMVAVHEMMPTKHRSKVAMLGINFINLGGVIVAIVDIATSAATSSPAFQRGMVALTLLAVLSLLLFARTRTPESPRWLLRKGRADQATRELLRFYGAGEIAARRAAIERAQERARQEAAAQTARGAVRRRRYPPLWLRLTAVIFVAFADTTGFGLLTYTLGPVHFPNLIGYIILATTLTGLASGLVALWADRFSRRWYLLIGYVGSLAFTLAAWLTESTWIKALALFWVLLVALNIFVNIAYITEDTLKGEVWPTRYRARFTALCRFVSIGGYIGTIYWTQGFTTSELIFFNAMVWVLGLVGALLWFFGGIETGRGTDIETVSNSEQYELLALPVRAPASGS